MIHSFSDWNVTPTYLLPENDLLTADIISGSVLVSQGIILVHLEYWSEH